MKNYERKSFIQIFLGYFISVTLFVLLLGFLYFNQQKTYLLQTTAMNMHQYLVTLQQSNFSYQKVGYSYKKVNNAIIKKQLPQKEGNFYIKAFSKKYIIQIDAKIVDIELSNIKLFTIILQIISITIFAFISFILTKKSLKPMTDTISHLDRFISDLIHDLNTPVTSILLNTKMLKDKVDTKELKKISRIENSAKTIASLYSNLEVLLNENSIIKEEINLTPIILDFIETYQVLYPNIKFTFTQKPIMVLSNKNAIVRIIDNILSNACKYSIDINPTINIDYEKQILIIQDNGKGIKYPKKIFERRYKEDDNGHGIGMHIIHRLCNELSHQIDVKSEENKGTIISLSF